MKEQQLKLKETENLDKWENKLFIDCISKSDAEYEKIITTEYLEEGKYPIIDQGQSKIAGYLNDKDKLYQGELPVIIFGDHTLILKYIDFPFAVGADGTKIIHANSLFTPKFFYYALCNLNIKSQGYQRHYKYLKDSIIVCPPIKQQQKIASILSKVDEQIEQTETIIEKTEEVNKGLKQKLLTKGIGHKKFKPTELGEIPEEWEVSGIGEYIELQGGYAFKSSDYQEDGIPLIRITNVSHGVIINDDAVFLPISYLEKYKEFCLKEGDIVLVLTRPIIDSGLKIAVTDSTNLPCLLNQRVGRFKIKNKKKVDRYFLYSYLNSTFFIDELTKKLSTMNQPNIGTGEVEKIKIVLPPLEEQEKISNILLNIDNNLRNNKFFLFQLNEVKRGIMKDLLTRKVKVKI